MTRGRPCIVLLALTLHVMAQVSVQGPLVDLYCWDNRNGIALDTGANLKVSPFAHTVHCLIEVGVCRSSGFAITHQPVPGGNYEILYLLDGPGNAEAVALMERVPVGQPRNAAVGFVVSASGTVDNSGTRPVLRVLQGSMTSPSIPGGSSGPATTTASRPTPAPTVKQFLESDFRYCSNMLDRLRLCWNLFEGGTATASDAYIHVGLKAPAGAGFVAIGLSDQRGGSMRGADIIAAINDPFDRRVEHYHSESFSFPRLLASSNASMDQVFLTPSNELVLVFNTSLASFIGNFTAPGRVFTFPMVEFILAYDRTGLMPMLMYHGSDRTTVSIDTRSGQVIGGSSTISASVIAHAALMGIAWAASATVAMFIATFVPKSYKWWFPVHLSAAAAAAVLTVAAFGVIVAYVENSSRSHFIARTVSPTAGAHGVIGVIVLCLVLIQIVLGIISDQQWRSEFAKKGVAPEKTVVDRLHWWSGRLLFLLALVNLVLGAVELQSVAAIAVLGSALFLWILLYVVLCVVQKNRDDSLKSLPDVKMKSAGF